jgi:hypothetical protein
MNARQPDQATSIIGLIDAIAHVLDTHETATFNKLASQQQLQAITRLSALTHRLRTLAGILATQAKANHAHRQTGHTSIEEGLAQLSGTTINQARHQLLDAERLAVIPEAQRAALDGQLNPQQAQTVAQQLAPARNLLEASHFERLQHDAVVAAQQTTTPHTRRIVRQLVEQALANSASEQATQQNAHQHEAAHRERHLTFKPSDAGSVKF